MRKIKNLLLIQILLLFSVSLYAQKPLKGSDIIIHITANGSGYREKFMIDIYKKSNSIKIVYAVLDSIQNSALQKDTAYRAAEIEYRKAKFDITERKTLNKLSEFFERYSAYDRDSVILSVKKDTVYTNLLNQIVNASNEDLEQKELNKNRFIYDGSYVVYSISSRSETKLISASNPESTTHPLLYNLLKSSLNIGRARQLGPFVHKKYFSGY